MPYLPYVYYRAHGKRAFAVCQSHDTWAHGKEVFLPYVRSLAHEKEHIYRAPVHRHTAKPRPLGPPQTHQKEHLCRAPVCQHTAEPRPPDPPQTAGTMAVASLQCPSHGKVVLLRCIGWRARANHLTTGGPVSTAVTPTPHLSTYWPCISLIRTRQRKSFACTVGPFPARHTWLSWPMRSAHSAPFRSWRSMVLQWSRAFFMATKWAAGASPQNPSSFHFPLSSLAAPHGGSKRYSGCRPWRLEVSVGDGKMTG